MSKPVYAADKPSDCHYCYFWTNGRKGCHLGRNNRYYLISLPPKPKSECDGCPYTRRSSALPSILRRLHRQRRQHEVCCADIHHHLQLRAKAQLLQKQIRFDVIQLAAEWHQLPRVQRAHIHPQIICEGQHRLLCLCRHLRRSRAGQIFRSLHHLIFQILPICAVADAYRRRAADHGDQYHIGGGFSSQRPAYSVSFRHAVPSIPLFPL